MRALDTGELRDDTRLAIIEQLLVHQSGYAALKYGCLLSGVLLVWFITFSPLLIGQLSVYVLLDIGFLLHSRRARDLWPSKRMARLALIAHLALLVAIFDSIALFLGSFGTYVAQMGALMLLAGQAFHTLASRTALIELMIPDFVCMPLTCLGLTYFAKGWATPTEQVIMLCSLATLYGFYVVVALNSNRLHTRLRSISSELTNAKRAQMIGQLTGGIAHDFNNLLTVMRGNLDLVREVPPDEQPALLAEIEAAATRGGALVARLAQTGRPPPDQPDQANVIQAAQRAACMARRTLPANVRIELFLNVPAYVVGRPIDLEMALLNLLMNSAEAMPKGGQIKLHIREARSPDRIQIVVEDEGAGMSPDMLSVALEPYQSSKPDGVGTGLGLAMVKAFVDEAGATLEIQSEAAVGTTVTMTLRRGSCAGIDGKAKSGAED